MVDKLDRILLLLAAIARNPGIGHPDAGVPRLEALQRAIEEIAVDRETPLEKIGSIKEDLSLLIDWGIIEKSAPNRFCGYRLAGAGTPLKKPVDNRRRKSKLSIEEIKRLHSEGATYREIAVLAEISHSRVGAIVNQR